MILYSKTRYVVSLLGYEKETRLEGKVLYVHGKSYLLRDLNPVETFIASLFWFALFSLDLYFYPFSFLKSLSIEPLVVWFVGSVVSFITFYWRIHFILGIGAIVVAFWKLLYVFSWAGGILAGYALFLLYLISTRALMRDDGVIIIEWKT